MAGIGGCPNVGGICIGCTMPGFPDKFMPFMDEPPGAKLLHRRRSASTAARSALRKFTQTRRSTTSRSGATTEPKLTTGYRRPGEVTPPPRAAQGRPTMAVAAPTRHRRAPKPSQIVEMSWDPITRIVGSLGIYTKIDFANREVAECHSTSSIFRGYSVFMKGKDPRDAHFITSRICGICGDNHATCAVYAQNMAFGVRPPALAEWIINLGEAAEYMFDHNLFQDNLVGVDFCEQMVKETNPGVLGAGQAAPRRRTPTTHGYRTIADIMRALNPFTGEFYRETLQMSR